ncbi:hypothetical protein JXA80_00915 [bacterium]|nr:hypothetical protein [candidate division CSSED10-310 bacterium]
MQKRRLFTLYTAWALFTAAMLPVGCSRETPQAQRESLQQNIPVSPSQRPPSALPASPLQPAPAIQFNKPGLSFHGKLAAPVFDESLRQLDGRDNRLNPSSRTILLRGGRYFDPCFINDTTIAVANLRGVDFFTLSYRSPGDHVLERLRQVDTPGHAWSVLPVGSRVWVAEDYGGVRVVNVADGVIEAHVPDLDNARSFHHLPDGGIVVCRHSGGADVVVTGDGCTIIRRIPLDTDGRVFSATSEGDRLYLGTLGGGYIAYARNATGGYSRDWTYTACDRILWCHVDGDIHYLMDRDVGLRILKSADGSRPVSIGLCERAGEWRHGCMKDNRTVLAAHAGGLLEIDVSDPSAPVIIHELPSPLESRGIAFRNGNAVITDSEYGLRWIRWTGTPPHPTTMAEHVDNGLVADVVVTATEAFVAHTRQGLERYRMTADTLTHVETWTGGDYVSAVDVHPEPLPSGAVLVAVADYRGAVLLEAISGESLKELSRITTPGRAVNVCLHDNLLLISDWFQGLRIMDVSDPSKPVFLASVATSGWVIDAIVRKSHAYVCAVNQGLLTVDITDPRHPLVTGTDTTVQAPEGIAATETCLYLADFNFGLMMYDLADPAVPTPVSCYKLRVCKGVQVRDTTLMLCHYMYGVKWFDIADPFQPVLIGERDTPGKSYEVAFIPSASAALVADWHTLIGVSW